MRNFKTIFRNNNVITNLLAMTFLLLNFSCNNSEKQKLSIKFDESKELEDVFQLEKFKKLNIDEEYKELTCDYYEYISSFYIGLVDIGGSITSIPDLTDTNNLNFFNWDDTKKDFIKGSLSTIWDATFMAKDALKAARAFHKRNELIK